MLGNMHRLISYLTHNDEYRAPIIPGSHLQEQREQRKKAIGKIIDSLRIMQGTLDYYLKIVIDKGEEYKKLVLGINS